MEKFREKLREILNSISILTLLFIKTCFNNKKSTTYAGVNKKRA